MTRSTIRQGRILFCFSLVAFSLVHSQTISVNGAVQAGSTINVSGVANETISVYSLTAKPANCNDPAAAAGVTQLNILAAGAAAPTPTYTLNSSTAQITFSTPIVVGNFLCLKVEFTPNGATNSAIKYAGPFQVQPPPAVASISIQGSPVAGTTAISVLSSTATDVEIFAFPYQFGGNPAPLACTAADMAGPPASLLTINAGGAQADAQSVTGSVAQTINLVNPLAAGARLCLVAISAAGAHAYSAFVDVQAAASPVSPSVNGKLVTSSSSPTKTISVDGEPNASLAIFQIDSSDGDLGCETAITEGKGTQLQIAAAGGSAAPTYSALLGTSQGPYQITLNAPLQAGTEICLEETVKPASGVGQSTLQYSSVTGPVLDEDNPYPKLRTFYVAGAMINNENGSASSSTGAEYIDIGLAVTVAPDVGRLNLNWANSISGLFSSIPVTAPSSTATTNSTTPSSSGTLNILSSQESVRVLGTTAFTMGEAKQDRIAGYQLFNGPIVRAGFDTLLNPSATAASGSATAVAQFAPVYTEYSGGWRVGLRHFNLPHDPSPRTLGQFDFTIGKFSNLQSLVCNPKVTSTTTSQPTNTSCYTPQTPGASSYTLDQQSRVTLLRPEVSGFINLGNSNFVLGLDANLPQSVDAPANLDIQNKAGGSVIIYFGYSGSLTGLFNSLKLPGSSQ